MLSSFSNTPIEFMTQKETGRKKLGQVWYRVGHDVMCVISEEYTRGQCQW